MDRNRAGVALNRIVSERNQRICGALSGKELMAHQKEKVELQIARLMKTLEKINYKMALFDVQEKGIDKLP